MDDSTSYVIFPRMEKLEESAANLIRSSTYISSFPGAVLRLLHNSIDAGSSAVQIYVDPRKGVIKLSDNGCGMDITTFGQVGRRCAHHSWKTTTLNSLATLGNVDIETRQLGTKYVLGKKLSCNQVTDVYEVSNPGLTGFGTAVYITGLFAALPVRQLSLEATAPNIVFLVCRILEQAALGTPGVNLTLWAEKRVDYSWCYTTEKSTRGAFRQLFGEKVLEDVCFQSKGVNIVGIASPGDPVALEYTGRYQFIYMNGNPVSSNGRINRFVNKLFRQVVNHGARLARNQNKKPFGSFPCFVLSIECDDSIFDFVYSNKSELTVEFKNWSLLEIWIRKLFDPLFSKNPSILSQKQHIKKPREKSENDTIGLVDEWKAFSLRKTKAKKGRQRRSIARGQTNVTRKPIGVMLNKTDLRDVKVIAQVGNKFIFTKLNKKLICFDQHAAHERIRLEQFEDDIKQRRSIFQIKRLEQPVVIHLTAKVRNELTLLDQYRNYLKHWGFTYKVNVDGELTLSTMPLVFETSLRGEPFMEMLDFILNSPGCQSHTIPPPIRRVIVSKACRGAIKFGDPLSLQECHTLIQDLSRCRLPFQCAHGRPTCVPLSRLK
uniref:MutL C-terminal dimerisation domain-containing protein n=1 Tax=Mucochytrium quahogii TaxID=96639 RepID=A0A7S2RKY4_9STRA|mmetsp:Transcript_41703/g.66984  ORF Transcript_41703/g.66984 Transcript_41703/m.66984 type:complete len:603 (+) Transcript_41703:319-2127(+)